MAVILNIGPLVGRILVATIKFPAIICKKKDIYAFHQRNKKKVYICKMENCQRFYRKLLIITILFFLASMIQAFAREEYSTNSLQNQVKTVEEGDQDGLQIADRSFSDLKGKKPKKPSKKISFETFEENYNKACDYYQKGLYISAAKLFEELYPLSLGSSVADTILYLFADCYFQFKEYANRYSSSPRAEEAHFRAIEAISHLSPEYSLDQSETYYVIEEIQNFVRMHPQSEHMEACNLLLDEMRDKLALKAYEILKLYYNTENYRSAQIVAKNFLKEHGSSQYADEAYALLVKNNYVYAQKSVESKKIERYMECVEAFESMKINFPGSELLPEAQKYANDAQAKIDKRETKNNKKKDKKNED